MNSTARGPSACSSGGGSHGRPEPADERDETPSERADRNFAERVQELRVAQTGGQIRFAFLLSPAFLTEFPRDDDTFKTVLITALVCAAGATICFIAPVAFHRIVFRQGLKESVVWVAQATSLAGLVLLLAAMALAVWLVVAQLWSSATTTAIAVGLVALAVLLWLVVPVWLRRQSPAE